MTFKRVLPFILLFVFSFSVFALDVEGARAAIKHSVNELILQCSPDLKNAEIRIDISLTNDVVARLDKFGAKLKYKAVKLYPSFKPLGTVMMPVQVTNSTGSKMLVYVKTKVTAFQNVVVASERISRKKTITQGGLKTEVIDITKKPSSYYTDPREIFGKIAATSISPGQIIHDWMVKDPPAICSGDYITLVSRGNNVVVASPGKSLSDGYIGQNIKVKRDDSREILKGVVLNSKEVEVR